MTTLVASEFHEFFASNKAAGRQVDIYLFYKKNPDAHINDAAASLGVSVARIRQLISKCERQKRSWEANGKPFNKAEKKKVVKFTRYHLHELMNLLEKEKLSARSSELISIYHKQFE